MIAVTALEKKAICEKHPGAYFARTMRNDSKRHHYFMVESGAPLRMLMELRGQPIPRGKRKGA